MSRSVSTTAFITSLIALSLPAVVSNRAIDDWPQWRGKNRDGVSVERGLLKSWPQGGPKLAWTAKGAGDGYSSFSVAGGKVYTLGARGGTEYVMAFDEATGKKAVGSAERRTIQQRPRGRARAPRRRSTAARSMPTARAATLRRSMPPAAKCIWKINVLQKFGGGNITWGLSESPLVLPDRDSRERRRPERLDRRGEPEGRIRSLAHSRERRAGLLVRRAPRVRRRAAGDLLHRDARGRGRQRATAGCCGATTAPRTGPPTSPRRSRVATRSSSRPTTAPAPGSWS